MEESHAVFQKKPHRAPFLLSLRFVRLALALLILISRALSPAAALAGEPASIYRIPENWIISHFLTLFSISSFLIVVWYSGSWLLCASDTKLKTPYPIFHIPYGLEPGYIGYIKKLCFEPELFLADLIDLGIRGFVVITPLENALSVSRTQKRWNELSQAHRAIMESLFEGGKPSALLSGIDGAGSDADIAFTKKKISLMPSFYGVNRRARAQRADAGSKFPALVKWNWKPVLFGLPLFIPFLLLMRALPGDLSQYALPSGLAVLFFMPFFTAAVKTVTKLRKYRASRESAESAAENGHLRRAKGTRHMKRKSDAFAIMAHSLMIVALLAVFSIVIPFFIISGLLSILFAGTLDPRVPTCAGAAIASALVFSAIMPVRTPEGRKLLLRAEGFEMFLKTAEKKRLETLYPFRGQKIPEFTLDLFERFLPYAFALGVAETWAESFEAMLLESAYSPAWHNGTFHIRSFCAGMRHLSLAISAAPRKNRRGARGAKTLSPARRRRGR